MSQSAVAITQSLPSGESFNVVLDARRAAYLPDCGCDGSLLVSDLHWGKGETFRIHGIPVPDTIQQSDLSRLSNLIDDYQPGRLLVLGDLIHGKIGLTDELSQKIIGWRGENGLPITLVAGNHDRDIDLVADSWGIEVVRETLAEPPFLFTHHYKEETHPLGLYNWCGHIHPAVRITSGTDRLRLPCFHLQKHGATLPAFSTFTGGYIIKSIPEDHIYAISDGLVIPISPLSAKS